MNRVLSGLLIGGLLLTSGGAVIAAGDQQSRPSLCGARVPGERGAGMQQNLKGVLDGLVKSSTISQEQADKLLSLQHEKEKQIKAQREKFEKMTAAERQALRQEKLKEKMRKRAGIFSEAVEKGIISQDEFKAIKAAINQAAEKERQAQLKTKLDELVSQKILSREQADAVLEQMQKKVREQQAEREKMKAMTPEARQQYRQDKGEKSDILDELIKNGTLTKAQAYDVSKILRGGFHGRGPGHPGGPFPEIR